jgi:hypothetical protein
LKYFSRGEEIFFSDLGECSEALKLSISVGKLGMDSGDISRKPYRNIRG